MSTTESRLFVLTEMQRYWNEPPDESRWRALFCGGELGATTDPDSDESYDKIPLRQRPAPPDDITPAGLLRGALAPGKFVYVFARSGPNPRKLFGAYVADANRNFSFYDEAGARLLTVPFAAPPVPVGGLIRISHTINGTRVFHSFIGSPVPLTPQAIQDLEQDWPPMIPELDLARDDAYLVTGEVFGTIVGFIGFVDPVTIANNLQIKYADACDRFLKFSVESSDMTPAERAEFRKRNAKVVLNHRA